MIDNKKKKFLNIAIKLFSVFQVTLTGLRKGLLVHGRLQIFRKSKNTYNTNNLHLSCDMNYIFRPS